MSAMSRAARERLAGFGAIVVALLLANVLGDVLRVPHFADPRSGAIAVLAAALLGAATGAVFARLRAVAIGRTSACGALGAALVAFLLLRAPSPWIDLGPFGAGPLFAVALVLFPLAQLAAVLAVRRWADR